MEQGVNPTLSAEKSDITKPPVVDRTDRLYARDFLEKNAQKIEPEAKIARFVSKLLKSNYTRNMVGVLLIGMRFAGELSDDAADFTKAVTSTPQQSQEVSLTQQETNAFTGKDPIGIEPEELNSQQHNGVTWDPSEKNSEQILTLNGKPFASGYPLKSS